MTVTMLDCIRRVPERLRWIHAHKDETFAALRGRLASDWADTDELVLVGSGTSNSSSVTARFPAERLAGARVSVLLPTELLHDATVLPPKALYVFVSQTGTSRETCRAQRMLREKGLRTAAVSAFADTPVARESELFLNMGCDNEEYGMRTIGYSCSVLTLIALGAELGLASGRLSQADYAAFWAQAEAAAQSVPGVIDATLAWLAANRRNLLRADCVVFTGTGALAGVAMEASIKMWETPQIPSFHYELEEGMHAPNFGYNQRHCLIVLNDGREENDKALSLCKFMKYEMGNGFLIGANAIDEHDLPIALQGGALECLEFAAAIQTLNYQLAVDQGRDLLHRDTHGNMSKYFSSHSQPQEAAKA